MKTLLTGAVWTGIALCSGGAPLAAQMQNNTEKLLSCQNNGNDGEQARHCEMREQAVAAMGPLTIDAGQNGGVTVKGWLQSGVLVRARVEGTGETQAAATAMASQVSIVASAGQVQAVGPKSANNSGWSVTYEIFVPQNTDLNLKAHNGGVTISDVRGQIHFDVNNGGVHLKRVGGDVSGATVNGGIQVDLAGAIWDGRQLEVSTKNGGVTLGMPSRYSAHIQAETSNGRISSDFPNTVETTGRPRKVDVSLGSSGPLIHVSTTNGGVSLKRTDTQ